MKKLLSSSMFIALLLFTGCGGGGKTSPSVQELAIKKIANYAQDDTKALPTVNDYTDAGLEGVDEDKLTKLNELVKELTYDDVDTKEELQKLLSSVGVTISNQAPTATAQTITMDEDTSKAITLTANDVDGDTLTYTVVTPPSHGTYADGVYTPTANYNGSDSFTFKANDGKLDSDIATISIVVNDVAELNTPPTATAQTITMLEDTTRAITLSGNDADGDNLTYTVVTLPTHGTYSNGVYTPTANYNGSDSFIFKANDGKAYSAPATVSITITDVPEPNHAPIANSQSVTLDEDTTRAITLSGNDADGDSLTYSVVTQPTHGTYTNGIYTPTANYHGSDSFSFTANDGSLTSQPATISITINDINDAPTVDAGADANITEGENYSPSPTSSDIDGTIASTVWKEGDTTLTFPKSDFSVGEHTLTITVTDDDGATASDTLTLTVNAKPVVNTCPLKVKTGQTTSYANFDDGDMQRGVERSYTRDDAKEVVTDNATHMMWQDDSDAQTITKTWQEAIDYCEALTLGDYSGWRLPKIEELMSITDKGRYNPAIDPTFQNIISEDIYNGYCWSSTTSANYSSNAWVVYFPSGADNSHPKSHNFYVRCVRDVKQ